MEYDDSKEELENLEKIIDRPIYNSYVWDFYKNDTNTEIVLDSLSSSQEEGALAQHRMEEKWIDPAFSKTKQKIEIDLSKKDIQDYEFDEESQQYREQVAQKFLEHYVNDIMSVLDFGCKTARIPELLSPHVKSIDCIEWGDTAIAHSEGVLGDFENATVYDARVGFHYGSWQSGEGKHAAAVFNPIRLPQLEFINKKYDFIYSYNAFKFFNIYAVYHFLDIFSSFLNPGGKIWINVHFDFEIRQHEKMFRQNCEWYKHDIYSNTGNVIEFVNTKALKAVCEFCGLEVQEINEWGECTFVKVSGTTK
jgi:hypothetical protein